MNMPKELFKEVVDRLKLYYPNCKLGYALTESQDYAYLSEISKFDRENGI